MVIASRRLAVNDPQWSALVARDPGASPAHRAEFPVALADALPNMEAHLIVVERDGHLLGGAPLVIERRAAFRWIHALPFLLSGAPLAIPGAHAEVDRAVGAMLARVQREQRTVGGEWSLYRPCGPAPASEAVDVPSGETRLVETSVLALGEGLDGAWRRIERGLRSELEHMGARGFECHEEPDALDQVYALHLQQSRAWPRHRPLPIALARRLLEPRAARAFDAVGPPARLFTIRRRGRLLAGILFLDGPHETFAWWSGALAEGRAAQAQAHLYWSVARWACRAGRTRLNMGGSTGRAALVKFKRSLGAAHHAYPVRWLDAGHAGGARQWVAALQAWRRRGRFRGAAGEPQ